MRSDYQRVRCNRCHWEGLNKDLRPIYVHSFSDPEAVDVVPGCPACQADQWLEYDDTLPEDTMYYLLMLEAKASLRDILEVKVLKLLQRAIVRAHMVLL